MFLWLNVSVYNSKAKLVRTEYACVSKREIFLKVHGSDGIGHFYHVFNLDVNGLVEKHWNLCQKQIFCSIDLLIILKYRKNSYFFSIKSKISRLHDNMITFSFFFPVCWKRLLLYITSTPSSSFSQYLISPSS